VKREAKLRVACCTLRDEAIMVQPLIEEISSANLKRHVEILNRKRVLKKEKLMTNSLAIFEGYKIRRHYDVDTETWVFLDHYNK
jgi:hypothetical protein